ncbi:hypothetical protein LTR84_003793 [Exophiala bonariae]|uniref:Xylanolytic transcriptional activator regulatory domain-containing protein n=1 Tax=Exophiala bonariae TaxID=1690606 RepID=A0AAV9N6H7_9EURO|nr:hypothetical protein LTR84_003793 [Exophiala bonariae]
MGNPSIHFRGLSLKYMEKAIAEVGDDPFSLVLLQTMILNTLCLLVQGVRGRAWRLLGTCIRSAYELNLHLIDAGKPRGLIQSLNAAQWCVEEEWRRAWWAIWEMDVFASVIRRCPAGIDWHQNDTFLPVEDEQWYHGEPQPSCALELDITERWKSLVAVDSKSPRAWFIVINSLMKDAQIISSPMNIDKSSASFSSAEISTHKGMNTPHQEQNKSKTDAINKLSTVLNSLCCTAMALPKELRYQGQYLDFGSDDSNQPGGTAQRQAYSNIYSIYMISQLTKLMVLKYHVFRIGMNWTYRKDTANGESSHSVSSHLPAPVDAPTAEATESLHLVQYFEASENVVSISRCCSDNYYKYVNPFHASTTWLAGAVQLLQRSRLPDDCSEKALVQSNFDLLSLNYTKSVDYWHMSKVPLNNWFTLEDGLESARNDPSSEQRYYHEIPSIFREGYLGHHAMQGGRSDPYGTDNKVGEQSKVDEIFKYLLADNGMKEDLPLEPLLSNQNLSLALPEQHDFSGISSLSNIYTPPPLPAHVHSYQSQSGTTTAEHGFSVDHINLSHADEVEAAVSASLLDSGHLALERNFNLDFSNYLDEIFSGSYVQ